MNHERDNEDTSTGNVKSAIHNLVPMLPRGNAVYDAPVSRCLAHPDMKVPALKRGN